jgi:hypothetical protein
MNTLRKIHAGFGLALVTSLALVAGSASADAADTSFDDASIGEATEAIEVSQERRILCTMSGDTPTRRQWAFLEVIKVTEDQVVCERMPLGIVAPAVEASCYQRKAELECTIIVR